MSEMYLALGGGDPTFESEADYAIVWAPKGSISGLDLGCGWRKVAPWLKGVDHHSGEWIEEGDKPHIATPDVVADVRELPFEDCSQDIVVTLHTLEHFADSEPLLKEWFRVLRVGGRLVVVVPDWRYTFSCKDENQVASSEGHKVDFTLDTLIRTVSQALPEAEILDARVVNYHWSVGIALEKVA